MLNRRHFVRALCGGAAVASALRAAARTIPDLRITGIKIHLISQALPEPMGYCCASGGLLGMKEVTSSVVEVETDAGLTGWGDGSWGGEILHCRARREPRSKTAVTECRNNLFLIELASHWGRMFAS